MRFKVEIKNQIGESVGRGLLQDLLVSKRGVAPARHAARPIEPVERVWRGVSLGYYPSVFLFVLCAHLNDPSERAIQNIIKLSHYQPEDHLIQARDFTTIGQFYDILTYEQAYL